MGEVDEFTPNIKEEVPKLPTPAEVDAWNLELQRTVATTVTEITSEKVQCEEPCAFRSHGKQPNDHRHQRLNPDREQRMTSFTSETTFSKQLCGTCK